MDIKNKVFNILSTNTDIKEIEYTTKQDGENSTVTTKLSISGYANTTGKDRQGDVVLSEAWVNGGLDNYLKNPILLAYHNQTMPIGVVTDYEVNPKGLKILAEISKAAGNVYDFIKDGVLRALSVRFRVKDADYDSISDIFIIKDLELLEISVVSVPANADSLFSVKKSFQSDDEYKEFKKLYSKEIEEPNKNLETQLDTKEKEEVDKDKISLTPEELAAEKQKAIENALANIKAEEDKKKAIEEIAITAGTSGAEKLLKDLEKKFSEKEDALAETIAELRNEIKEKSSEIDAITRNKMSFEPNPNRGPSKEEIDKVILVAKALGKPVDSTEYFKKTLDTIVSKDNGPGGAQSAHITGMTYAAQWETEFSTRMYEEIKDRTIMEPLFTNRIQMTTRTMAFPWNPEAGYAQWVLDTNYNSGTAGEMYDGGESTGNNVTHTINDNVIQAEKLATKEFISYEEEEDTILPIVPIIRDAVIRRMVRSTDTELLRANAGANTGSGTAPASFNGVSTIASDNSRNYTGSGAFGDPATIADLQGTRRLLGRWGVAPGDVLYVVSENVYYDLLEDPDFRTMDLVGANATILRGQIGMVNGSPVVVSDSFVADAASTVQAIALNVRNYLFGELRGLMVENGKDIINQKNAIIASRRFGFKEIVPGATTGYHACANLVRPA